MVVKIRVMGCRDSKEISKTNKEITDKLAYL